MPAGLLLCQNIPMNETIDIAPTEEDLSHWIREFVPKQMLWYWDDDEIPNHELAARIVPREDISKHPDITDIHQVNAFHLWAMPEAVTKLVVDDGSWISSLSANQRSLASAKQVAFNRGLCISQYRFGDGVHFPDGAISGETVVLDPDLWHSLPETARRKVIETELPEWDDSISFPIPESTSDHLKEIANRFILQQGVNCLSVTAYAITGNQDDLMQWMNRTDFARVLQTNGYTRTAEPYQAPGDVILFRDAEGNIVHAGYILQPNRLLNKNGQSSFNPITITDFQRLRDQWQDFTGQIYRQ